MPLPHFTTNVTGNPKIIDNIFEEFERLYNVMDMTYDNNLLITYSERFDLMKLDIDYEDFTSYSNEGRINYVNRITRNKKIDELLK